MKAEIESIWLSFVFQYLVIDMYLTVKASVFVEKRNIMLHLKRGKGIASAAMESEAKGTVK
jgi:hypothetical protein